MSIKQLLPKIWNDPVGSKVISAIIIALLIFIYQLIAQFFSWITPIQILVKLFSLVTQFVNIPIWLLVVLLTLSFALIVIVAKEIFLRREVLTEFYTVSEIAKKLRVDEERVYQWGITGKLIFAYVRHTPSNYEEIRHKTEKGKQVEIRKKVTTVISFSNEENPSTVIVYFKPNDSARIILNTKEDREILITEFFETNELLPEKSKKLVGSTLSVKKEELIITKDELKRFRKKFSSELKQEAKNK